MSASLELTPLVLLIDDQEWTSKSLEGVLRPRGHVVLKAFTGQQALDLVQKVSPDAILVDVKLPDIDGIDLLRRLRSSPTVHATTPLLIVTDSPLGRAERLEALSAGAWDILSHPVDPNELILRMDTFVRAKQEADRVRDEGLTDPTTGFYNVRGILQRTKEISADAVRHERPITCIAFGPSQTDIDRPASEQGQDAAELVSRPVAVALRHVTRLSDTIGKLGPGEFVVVAPGTDEAGALRLADRVLEAIMSEADAQPAMQVRAGFCAMPGQQQASPEDLLLRATMALRQAQGEDGPFRVRAFEA
jgi:diguanylate cyclase (GGDEF)-like protein